MNLVIFTEEPSMKVTLHSILQKLAFNLGNVTIIEHQGVGDLEKSLPRKLRAWRDPDARFIILRDNENGDCIARKLNLMRIANGTGRGAHTKVRIVCQELEAWFIGDTAALSASTLFGRIPRKLVTCNPDDLPKPSKELSKLRRDYGKITGAKKIAPLLDLENNRSASFRNTIEAIRRLIAA